MHKATLLAGSIAILLTACSSGSSGGATTVSGLTPPDSLDIVTPVENTAPPASGGVVVSAATDPGFDPTAQYYTDAQRVHVYDPAVEPLQIINMILCFMGQTGAGQLVNEDPYIAQVDVAECEDGGNRASAGSAAGQSAGESTDLELWTVSSQRASETAPQEVRIWVPEDDEGAKIFVDVSVSESASDTDPFGQFEMNFAGTDDVANIGTPVMRGTLATIETPAVGDMGFTFYENMGDVSVAHAPSEESRRVQVRVEMTDDETEGWAHILSSMRYNFGGGDSGLLTQQFEVAFDATHFMRATDGGAPVAYQRDTFTENVWSYNLYYLDGSTAGQRVDFDGGFGIRTAGGEYGWAGYYGIWVPDSVTLSHGDTVTSENYGEEANEAVNYTVFKAPGRLIRFGKEALALTDIEGMVFEWWTWDSMTSQSVIYRTQYFNGTSQWKKVATIDPQTYTATPIVPAETIDTAAEGVLDMWSDALGGHVVYVDGETEITFYTREFVDGGDAVFSSSSVLTLYGFDNALKSNISTAEAENGDVYLPTAPDVMTPYVLEFRESDLTLHLDTDGMGAFQPVGLGAGQAPTMGPNTWGMNSGPLVTPAVAGTLTSVWDAWNADEFFVYETGHNEWNQFTGLVDGAGQFVAFDEPMHFTYVHSTADDRNGNASFDGMTFFLQYEGMGNLHGFPYDGVDLNGDSQPDRWYPIVNLDDGTVLTDDAGVNYVVKAVEIEQALAEDGAYAGSLDVSSASALVLPDGSDYQTPDIGAEPVVTDPPRVISGVVQ